MILISFLVYLPCLQFDFVNWDDSVNIYKNPYILNITDWPSFAENVKNIFSNDILGNYTPLSTSTFAVEKMIFGLENPGLWHLSNIILHLICVLLVFRISLALGLQLIPAAFCALLFGIHPMRVESVVWISERKDVLFGTFYLLALYYYIKSVKLSFSKRYYFVIIASFILALLSKIQAVSLPLSMLAVDYYFARKLSMKLIYEKWFYFLLSLITGVTGIYLLNHHGTLGHVNSHLSFFEKHLPAAFSFIVYLGKSIVPYKMVPFYEYPQETSWVFYLKLAFIFILIQIGYLCHLKNKRAIVFGLLFFTFNIMFLLQVLSAGQAYLADRFTYIPYLGIFFIYAYGLQFLLKRYQGHKKTIVYITLLLVLAAYGSINNAQCLVWRNCETLWAHELKHYPDNLSALYNRGEHYREEGQYEEALKDFSRYIALHPTDPKAFIERSVCYAKLKRFGHAFQDLEKAEKMAPELPEIYRNRSVMYARLGNYGKSERELKRYLELKPGDKEMWNILAMLNRFN